MKLNLDKTETEFLAGFLLHHLSSEPNAEYVLEQCVCAELYARYLQRFTLPSAGKLTLTAAEAIALKRLLCQTPLDGLAHLIRNNLYLRLQQAVGWN